MERKTKKQELEELKYFKPAPPFTKISTAVSHKYKWTGKYEPEIKVYKNMMYEEYSYVLLDCCFRAIFYRYGPSSHCTPEKVIYNFTSSGDVTEEFKSKFNLLPTDHKKIRNVAALHLPTINVNLRHVVKHYDEIYELQADNKKFFTQRELFTKLTLLLNEHKKGEYVYNDGIGALYLIDKVRNIWRVCPNCWC